MFQDYKAEWDPKLVKSEKTGRGPLQGEWKVVLKSTAIARKKECWMGYTDLDTLISVLLIKHGVDLLCISHCKNSVNRDSKTWITQISRVHEESFVVYHISTNILTDSSFKKKHFKIVLINNKVTNY